MYETYSIERPRRFVWVRYLLTALILFTLAIVLFWWFNRAPGDFPVNEPVVVPRGLSASAIADLMDERGVVRSNLILYLNLLWRYDPNNIQAGTYIFGERLTTAEVAERLATAGASENLIILTLPEGYTAKEFAGLAKTAMPEFDEATFIELTKGLEGYLFPDTYYLPEDYSPAELATLLQETYEEKLADRLARMEAHPLGIDGVVTLASLIEREANSPESMKLVSGILQKRLDEGMRLQVDASMEYVLNKPLHSLTAADLEIDSPYNTYLNDGLPPTPIGNPGLQAIDAVLEPTESNYYYYLTDEEGNFYYARTFDEHKQNIAKYLN